MEKKIYNSWAFTQNEEEKFKINKQILEELENKYKICKVSDINHKEPTKEQLEENDIVFSRSAEYLQGDYRIYKCPDEINVDEIALICDDGNLCFGYRGDRKHIIVYED